MYNIIQRPLGHLCHRTLSSNSSYLDSLYRVVLVLIQIVHIEGGHGIPPLYQSLAQLAADETASSSHESPFRDHRSDY